jgi:hypothetical protein
MRSASALKTQDTSDSRLDFRCASEGSAGSSGTLRTSADGNAALWRRQSCRFQFSSVSQMLPVLLFAVECVTVLGDLLYGERMSYHPPGATPG